MMLIVGLLFLFGCTKKPVAKIEDPDLSEEDVLQEPVSIKIEEDKDYLVIEFIDDLPSAYEVFAELTIGEEIRSNKAFLNIDSDDARLFQTQYDNMLESALSIAKEAVEDNGQQWSYVAVQDTFKNENLLSFKWVAGWFLYRSGGMSHENYFSTFDLNSGNAVHLKELIDPNKYIAIQDMIVSDVKTAIQEINHDFFFDEHYPETIEFIDTVYDDIEVNQESTDDYDKTFVYISSPYDFMVTENKIYIKYEVFYMFASNSNTYPIGYKGTAVIDG